MSKIETARKKIRSKLDAIKAINNDPSVIDQLIDGAFEAQREDLPDVGGFMQKRITDLTSKVKGKTKNKKDIFGELIKTTEGFLGTDKQDDVNLKKKPLLKSKLKKYAKDSAHITLQDSRNIVMDSIKRTLFGGGGICGGNSQFNVDTAVISPKEFDFLNVLKLDPTSTSGQIMYESPLQNQGDIKFNRKLYEFFDSPNPYFFQTKDYNTLFRIQWDGDSQEYNIAGLQGLSGTTQVGDFLTNYYSSIEFPDIQHITKTAMLMTLQGDGGEPSSFNLGMNDLDRLLQKLFSLCGTPNKTNPVTADTTTQFEEDEEDIESYFDFDDVEGIDLDDENNRKRRVLKFRDCDNYEVPINSNHIEDFVFLLNTDKGLDNNIDDTLMKAAADASEQGSLGMDDLQISLTNLFILKLPKALVASVLSPKIFLPIVILYKQFQNVVLSAKEIMRKLAKLFSEMIRSLFWRFISEFWRFIKRDLLEFVRKIAKKIFKNKLKRWKGIILALITLLLAVLASGLDNCEAIFNIILTTITTALNAPIRLPIPGLLLVFADMLPGFSTDRAFMNVQERLTAMGVNTGPIFGEENKLNAILKGMIDGHSEEMDQNSFVKIALKPSIIPAGPGGAVISPLVTGVGKMF
jgi:hypothetical protein